MKQCNLCNSENLMTSRKESNLVPGAKYVHCKSCGNVMLLTNDILIPTPNSDTDMTKAMIEDAANAFSEQGLASSSLYGLNREPHMQPSNMVTALNEYVNTMIGQTEEIEDEEEFDMDMEEENCDCSEPCEICECDNTRVLVNHNTILEETYKDYLLVNKAGEKQLYKGCDKEFILNVINSIGSEVKLYEIKEIKLKQEVKYNF